MKPLLKYGGGKSKEIPQILQHVPKKYNRYIEPFCGGAALYWHLEPKKAILNDLNTKLMVFYLQVCRKYTRIEREIKELDIEYTRNSNEYQAGRLVEALSGDRVVDKNEQKYTYMRHLFNYPDEHQYLQGTVYFYINHTAYGGMVRYNAKGEFNIPYGRYKTLGADVLTREHSELLEHAELWNVDYTQIFTMAKPDDFMFIDPPYNSPFSDFGNQDGGWDADRHTKLAEEYKRLQCPALMVIGVTPLIESLYKDYICGCYDVTYSANIKNRFDRKAKHLIIRNY